MKSSILSIFVFSWSDTQFGIQEARNVNEYPRNHNDNTRHKTKLQKEIYFKSIGEHSHLNKVINRCLAKEKNPWHEVFRSNFLSKNNLSCALLL